MIKRFISAMAIGCAFIACESGTDAPPEYKGDNNKNSNAITVVPVDYSAAVLISATPGIPTDQTMVDGAILSAIQILPLSRRLASILSVFRSVGKNFPTTTPIP